MKASQLSLDEILRVIWTGEPPVDNAETVNRSRHGRHGHRLVVTADVAGRLPPSAIKRPAP